MFTHEEMEPPEHQPGRLDYGLFLTVSSSNSGRNHWIRIRGVTRHGDLGPSSEWRWDTYALPMEVLQEVLSVLQAKVIMELEHRYGIQDELPM
jgi:hypothetical protein